MVAVCTLTSVSILSYFILNLAVKIRMLPLANNQDCLHLSHHQKDCLPQPTVFVAISLL